MAFNTFPEFNYDDLTWLKDNSIYGDDFGFDGPSWDQSGVAGPSQPYTGLDVFGDYNNYPEFPSPSAAPISLNPTYGMLPEEGYLSPFYQGSAMPSFPLQPVSPPPIHPLFNVPSPVPALSGSHSLSPELHGAPITPPYRPYAQPQVIPNPDDLGYDFSTGAGSSSLPAVHHPPTREPSYEELVGQFPQPSASHFDARPFDPVAVAGLPATPLPPPVASSSGPTRTRRSAREGRKYDPIRAAEKAATKREGWDLALPRFRTRLHEDLYTVQNGQPSGGLVPAMALATIDKLVKEDLKRSPLRDAKAGKGERSRNVEDYLKGLLGAIRRVESPPKPEVGESDEDDTSVAALSRLAGELERELVAVNQGPSLRRLVVTSQPKQRAGDDQTEGQTRKGKSVERTRKVKPETQAKKSKSEAVRRDAERYHLERMCLLFRAPAKGWTRREVLSFAVLFRIYGAEAFQPGFVEVRPTAPGL